MVLEVAPNGREVDLGLDAGCLEDGLRTDAAQLEELRGEDAARRKDHLLVRGEHQGVVVGAVQDLDSSGHKRRVAAGGVVEENRCDLVHGQELQVAAVGHRVVVRIQGGRARLVGGIYGRRSPVVANSLSSRMLFDKWQAELVKCVDNLICDRSASAAVSSELGVRTQVRGLPVGIAGLGRPILAPCGYVVRVVVLRFDLGRRRCKCHRLGTGDISKTRSGHPLEQHTFLI